MREEIGVLAALGRRRLESTRLSRLTRVELPRLGSRPPISSDILETGGENGRLWSIDPVSQLSSHWIFMISFQKKNIYIFFPMRKCHRGHVPGEPWEPGSAGSPEPGCWFLPPPSPLPQVLATLEACITRSLIELSTGILHQLVHSQVFNKVPFPHWPEKERPGQRAVANGCRPRGHHLHLFPFFREKHTHTHTHTHTHFPLREINGMNS